MFNPGPIDNLYIVYDFQVENTFLPNCLNLERANKIFENNGYIDDTIMEYYFKYHRQIPVLNNNMSVSHELLNKITTSEYINNSHDTESVYLYLVEPYANITHILGGEHSIDKGKYFLEFASKPALKEIQNPNNNFYLVVSFPTEGTLNDELFDAFYKICDTYEIPKHKFIFISASYDVERHHLLYRKSNNRFFDDSIKTFYWCWSLREKAQEYFDIIKHSGNRFNINSTLSTVVTEDNLNGNIRNKKLLIFNRRMRAHRVILISLLGYNIIKDNYISYDFTKGENDYNLDFFQQGDRLPKEVQLSSYDNLLEIQQKKQISSIDFDDVHGTVGFGCEINEPYLDSYIHVVTETNFYEPGLYFSEKTWKPILNFQPFIQLNYANSLKALREMGFKTFHPFIDESYDLIEDNKERILAVSNEIRRLNLLSIDEIHKWYYDIKDILIHNRNHAIKYRHENEFQVNEESKFLYKIINYVKFDKKNTKIF